MWAEGTHSLKLHSSVPFDNGINCFYPCIPEMESKLPYRGHHKDWVSLSNVFSQYNEAWHITLTVSIFPLPSYLSIHPLDTNQHESKQSC